jgi:hypothetical protein
VSESNALGGSTESAKISDASSLPANPPIATADLKTDIGSEIPSLDSKDESVLSDSQIKEMASTTAQAEPTIASSIPTPPTTSAPSVSPTKTTSGQAVVNDVVVPDVVATLAPATVPASTASAATINSPTSIENVPSDKAVVAGVTMSREDALKLALGEESVTEDTKSKSPAKPTAIVMTVIGLALLGTFLWQTNYSDFSVKLASIQAGLTASVPGFVPTGWSKAQSVKTSQGSLSYELVKDGKSLTVEQQKSDWDSQAVLEQHVLKKTTDYLALQAQGLTIYMYGDNQAVWVNQGTLYTLSGDHGIDQDDIIRMATSL